MVDSAIRIKEKYYLQTLLEDCKYKTKNYKMKGHIDYDFDSDLADDSDNYPESDNEFDNNESDNNELEKLPKKSDKNESKRPFKLNID